MYRDAEPVLERILALVDKCPEPLKEKAFEIMLTGYVDSLARPVSTSVVLDKPAPPSAPDTDADKRNAGESVIPAALVARFRSTARRLEIPLERLEALFDFATEPFTFHALHVPGDRLADKARSVALLVAAKSYLTSGNWTADWKEVKAQCVDQNCYDSANHASTIKKGQGGIFKSVDVGKSIELSSTGQTEAQNLIKKLATADAAAK